MYPQPKPKTYRNRKYLDHVRKRPCCICGKQEIEIHHQSLYDAGFGQKSGDLTTASLCQEHHGLIHADPNPKPLLMLALYEEIIINLRNWIQEKGL